MNSARDVLLEKELLEFDRMSGHVFVFAVIFREKQPSYYCLRILPSNLKHLI